MLVMIKALCIILKKILKENKVTKQIISTQTLDTTIIELEHKAGTAITIAIMRNSTAAMIRILIEIWQKLMNKGGNQTYF